MERRHLLGAAGATALGVAAGCSGPDEPAPRPTRTSRASSPSSSPATSEPAPGPVRPRVERTLAEGMNVPWGLAFLRGGDALVSQRDTGTVVRVGADGGVRTIGEVPGVVAASGLGEGGLLGLAFAPGDESVLYAYCTSADDDRVVAMAHDGRRLGRPRPLVTGIPTSTHHHGGRLLFSPAGHLYVSTGDAEQRELAQDRASLAGKILRVDRDGAPVPGNPFGNRTWSYGHRNVEGLALDAGGRLWATEFGDKSADELNVIVRGRNYGWPRVEGGGGGPGLADPARTWATSACSPAGLAITRSTAFVGALQGRCLFAVPLDGRRAGTPRAYLREDDRIRSVALAPDGALWVTTSNTDGRRTPRRDDDRLLRVTLE